MAIDIRGPLLRRVERLLRGEDTANTAATAPRPETVRDPSLAPSAGGGANVANAPWSAASLTPGDLSRAVAEIKALLDLSIFDWAVTSKEAHRALDQLAALSPADLAEAVERLGPALLTRMESKLRDRSRQAETLTAIRALRNAPGIAPDRAAFTAEAREQMRGFMKLSRVDADRARQTIDGLRRFDAATQEAILDDLGPTKTHWMMARLSETDREIYAPILDRCRSAHFGALARAEAAAGLAPKDSSARFFEVLAAVQAGTMKLDPNEHGKVTYLFVPGLVTEHQPGYFSPGMNRLRDRGLNVVESKLDTDADIETNAATLRKETEAIAGNASNKVFVVSHSKGGPDARRALQDPATERRSFFFLSLQGAFGTPVANQMMDGPLGDIIEDALANVLGATNGNALRDLDYQTQKRLWLGAPPLEVPTLSLATTMGEHRSLLRASADLMKERYGVLSDGLVPFDEQKVGGKNAHLVAMDGVDHAAPASRPTPGFEPKYDPADVLEALILLSFELESKQHGLGNRLFRAATAG